MTAEQPKQTNYMVSLATLTSLFFMWGFITCMNDILIPHLKELFRLSYLQAMLVQFCFFGAYFIGSLIYFLISYFRSDPINRIGYKNGILLGLLVSAIGCFLFYPAAELVQYGLFLSAFFILGIGFTLLQITANPFVALLGEESTASGRLNLVQGFNALGTTIAPVLGGYLIFELFAEGNEITGAETKWPYIAFGVVFLLLFILIKMVNLPVFKNEDVKVSGLGALRYPQLRLGALGIFCYVGAEVAIGSFLINYTQMPEIARMSESVAKNYLSLYWGGAMVGRFLGAICFNQRIVGNRKAGLMILIAIVITALIFSIVDLSFHQVWVFGLLVIGNLLMFSLGRFLASKTLLCFAIVNVFLILIAVFGIGEIALWSLVAIGLFNSVMWSNIFTLAISGLKEYTSQGSSLLVMSILGGALVPLVQGGIADHVGLRESFLLPALCYVYIAYFGYYCLKKRLDNRIENTTTTGEH